MSFINKLSKEKKVKVRGDSIYVPHVGEAIHYLYNGVRVTLPLDDGVYEFPETIAKDLERRKQKISEMVTRPKKNNREVIADINL